MHAPAPSEHAPRAGALQTAVAAALLGVRRFPLMIASGWTTALVGAWMVSLDVQTGLHERIVVAAVLGIPLFFALALLAERRTEQAHVRLLMQAAGLIPVALVGWRWAHWPPSQQPIRFLQLALLFHLAASVLPFIGADGARGFWEYNKTLLLRALTTGLWAAVLFIAMALALAALDALFGLTVDGDRYVQLWLMVAFGFSVWFFASGMPESLDAFEHDAPYPRPLRYFVQYLLVPIVAVYLCILTAYLAKVLFTREWPSGWIGWLVTSVAVVGTLCWLLLQPLTSRDEDSASFRWVRTFSRAFFVAMLPAIGMLWAALWQRVGQYGVTEPRLALFVLSAWFAGVAVFYLVTRSRTIVLVPASLGVVALVTFMGPVSLASISRTSQLGRLETTLREAQLLVGDSLVPRADQLTEEQRTAVRRSLEYVYGRHGAHAMPWPLLATVDSSVNAARDSASMVAARNSTARRDSVGRDGARNEEFLATSASVGVSVSRDPTYLRTREAMRRLGELTREDAVIHRRFSSRRASVRIDGFSLQVPMQLQRRLQEASTNEDSVLAGTATASSLGTNPDSVAASVRWNGDRSAVIVVVNGAEIADITTVRVLAALDSADERAVASARRGVGDSTRSTSNSASNSTSNSPSRARAPRDPLQIRLPDRNGNEFLLVIDALGVSTTGGAPRFEDISGSVYLTSANVSQASTLPRVNPR